MKKGELYIQYEITGCEDRKALEEDLVLTLDQHGYDQVIVGEGLVPGARDMTFLKRDRKIDPVTAPKKTEAPKKKAKKKASKKKK